MANIKSAKKEFWLQKKIVIKTEPSNQKSTLTPKSLKQRWLLVMLHSVKKHIVKLHLFLTQQWQMALFMQTALQEENQDLRPNLIKLENKASK